jgi:AmpE protein
MTLIALLIGLIIERMATQFFHVRRLRWLDRIIDGGFNLAERFANWPALIPVVLLAAVLALPVFVITFSLGDALLGFPYLVLAIIVLFFSLGPKDIGEDVDEYCSALQADDEELVQQTAKAIVEDDVPTDTLERIRVVEEAVCVQANNRLFAVVFWFVFLGPLGAWLYRVTDLIRRRAVFSAARADEAAALPTEIRDAAVILHSWLAWVPARLTAIGYAIAGHFDGALAAWRVPSTHRTHVPSHYSEDLLARVGVGALALHEEEGEDLTIRGIRGAMAANRLVFRLLLIWFVVIAAMTLYGFSI